MYGSDERGADERQDLEMHRLGREPGLGRLRGIAPGYADAACRKIQDLFVAFLLFVCYPFVSVTLAVRPGHLSDLL